MSLNRQNCDNIFIWKKERVAKLCMLSDNKMLYFLRNHKVITICTTLCKLIWFENVKFIYLFCFSEHNNCWMKLNLAEQPLLTAMVPKSPGISVRPKEPLFINQISALCFTAQEQPFVTFQYGGRMCNRQRVCAH